MGKGEEEKLVRKPDVAENTRGSRGHPGEAILGDHSNGIDGDKIRRVRREGYCREELALRTPAIRRLIRDGDGCG